MFRLTSGEVGLVAVGGAVVVASMNNWIMVRVGRQTRSDQREVTREDRLWPERAKAYVAWLASNEKWAEFREDIERTVRFAVMPEVTIEQDFFTTVEQRNLRARVSAFASNEVRNLLDSALAADKAFFMAHLELRQFRESNSACGTFQGDGEESVRLHHERDEQRTAAREADERVASQMRAELQGERPPSP